MQNIIALSTRSASKDGSIFVAAASAQIRGRGEVALWHARCPTSSLVLDPWINEYVLPALDDPHNPMETNCTDMHGLLQSWMDFFSPLRHQGYAVVTHALWPFDMRMRLASNGFDPASWVYPVLDIASALDMIGQDPLRMHWWLDQQLCVPIPGMQNNPIYEARCTAQAYWILKCIGRAGSLSMIN